MSDAIQGIDEAAIARLVHRFYDAVRRDPLLGPVFEARVRDWDAHLATLTDYWSALLLGTRRYDGRPLARHAGLGLRPAHFARWLSLFDRIAAESCPPAMAAAASERAHRIGQSFMQGLAVVEG